MTHAAGDECGPAAGGRLSACPVAEDRIVTRSNLSPTSDPPAVTPEVLRAW